MYPLRHQHPSAVGAGASRLHIGTVGERDDAGDGRAPTVGMEIGFENRLTAALFGIILLWHMADLQGKENESAAETFSRKMR